MKFVLILLCFCFVFAQSYHIPPTWAQDGLLGQRFAAEINGNQNRLDTVNALTIDMPLDHFNKSETRTFALRYWIDASCFQPGGPIFLYMGGEAVAGGQSCGARDKQFGAVAVAYEHRFYGKSFPAGDLIDANMPFLSVEQNLADAKYLVEYLKSTQADYAQSTVIAYGGSYSGATCAWFRIAYPETVSGCVSSSGVVNAIFKFTAFDNVIAEATMNPDPKCNMKLARAYKAIDRAFDNKEGDKIKAAFNATHLIGTPNGDADFMYAIADGPAMLVQYGAKDMLCDHLSLLGDVASDEEIIDNLNSLITVGYGAKFTQQCFYDSECLKTQYTPSWNGVGERQWRWQKCSQLAYFQAVPSSGEAMRSKRLSMDALLDQCEYIFGRTPDTSIIDEKFGADDPKGSNIFFLDFSDDPWKAASVNHTIASSMQYCMTTCDGCGHCGSGAARNFPACDNKATDNVAIWLKNAKH